MTRIVAGDRLSAGTEAATRVCRGKAARNRSASPTSATWATWATWTAWTA
ncbi:hypothetical protein [Streptomyces broussonetiae]|nr:hypothetical protein [Streptomyces broussonetiae]